AALLTEVWSAAGISPATISYLEAHGTGTELGDPIEVEGIQAAFAELAKRWQITLPAHSCGLGSVKSNIGHLEPASGVAGLIKVLLALRHHTLPATLHCHDVNPYIHLEPGPLYLTQRTQPWIVPEGQPRRAGVSSFGFGGVNAHILVEEAAALESAPAPAQPRLFPLSARNAATLRARAEQLRNWMTEQALDTGGLADLAFTLQTGREAFEYRLAIMATTAEELLRGLDGFLAGEPEANLYQGGLAEPRPWRELLAPSTVTVANGNDLSALVTRWTSGENLDWATLQPAPRRRLHLPVYPFTGPRYWPISAPIAPAMKSIAIHRTVTRDDWELRDHRVGDESVLPAMACVAMAWNAACDLAPEAPAHGLHDLTWLRPLKVGSEARELTLSLHSDGQDDPIRFELHSRLNGATPELHAQGEIGLQEPVPHLPTLDLTAIRQRCPQQWPGSALYERLAVQHLHYGPSFRLLDRVWSNDDEALGELRPPLPETEGEMLHPALLDAALQTAAVLTSDPDAGSPVPFALSEVQVAAPLHTARYAYVCRRGHNGAFPPMDISLCDAQGRVLTTLRDFHARPLQLPSPLALNTNPLRFFVPGWRAATLTPSPLGRASGRTLLFRQPGDGQLGDVLARALGAETIQVWLAGGWQRLGHQTWRIDANAPDQYQRLLETVAPDRLYFPGSGEVADALDSEDALAAAQETLLTLFRLLRAMGQQPKPPALRIVTQDLYPFGTKKVAPWAGTLIGLCRSFALEYPNVDLHCIDLGGNELSAHPAPWLNEPADPADVSALQWVWREGQCLVQTLEALELPAADLPFRAGGVYLLTGGAGGLGAAFARQLAGNYQARLLLTGRRLATDPAITQLLAELTTLGGKCLYVPVDARDREGMAATLADLHERWGELNGVLHCPLELCNTSLATMSESQLLSPLAAKIEAAAVLRDLLRDEPLDFVALFSSAIALTGGAGQGNYAAASTGMDAIARAWRAEVGYPVKTLNWGYWGETGIVATPEHRALVARQGVASIGTDEGIAAFAAMLAAPQPEIMAIKLLAESAGRTTPALTGHTSLVRESNHPGATRHPSLVRESNHPGATRHPSLSKEGNPSPPTLAATTRDYLRACFAEVLH
ncbi:MAG: hypothetical protein QG599_1954, partial [Pseudomonadota bacterium]|nr:hypothetical protein [Pseudomonadota bacterium]